MKLEEMTNEELLKGYEEAKRYAETWSNSQDGSYEMAWSYEVGPYIRELKKRGLY